ncbi:MAG: nthA [Frankiales bacterium]|nr:nthA [Frankiales bacterium]
MSDEHDDAAPAAQTRHVEGLLEAKGLLDANELDRALEAFASGGSPAQGARVAARAWVDDGFRTRLLMKANDAVEELGLSMGGGIQPQRLKVVANSATEHNVIVCTLCSCYPIAMLGPSPTWYKSEAYRSRVVRDPRSVLADFGTTLPDDVHITVWDASSETRYMVLPNKPAELPEADLAAMVTRNGLIGTAVL